MLASDLISHRRTRQALVKQDLATQYLHLLTPQLLLNIQQQLTFQHRKPIRQTTPLRAHLTTNRLSTVSTMLPATEYPLIHPS